MFLHVQQVQVGNTVYGQVPRNIWLSHDVNIDTPKATNSVGFFKMFHLFDAQNSGIWKHMNN